MRLSVELARRIALAAGSGFGRVAAKGPAAVTETVQRLGFVQIDTISVVERAHHHILRARVPDYRPEWLEEAAVFEYWAHAACYLPWTDFRHTLPRKKRLAEHGHDWFQVDPAEVARVRDRIRGEGPLRSQDFESDGKRAGWWDWKPSKLALDYLFQTGELMSLPRQGFQKVFDLTERVLPPGLDTREPTPREHADWCIDRALDVWGLVARDELAYQRKEPRADVGPALAAKVESGELTVVTLEGVDKPYWVRTAALSRLDALPKPDNRLRVLSPFDPLVIHRKRLQRLFGYDLKLECYVPEAKRTFGYFGMPLVWGDTVAGLLDGKLDRAAKTFTIKNFRYEGPARQRAAFDKALTKALAEFLKPYGATASTPEPLRFPGKTEAPPPQKVPADSK